MRRSIQALGFIGAFADEVALPVFVRGRDTSSGVTDRTHVGLTVGPTTYNLIDLGYGRAAYW